jgi:capsular polysaccharide biosynthesis protein
LPHPIFKIDFGILYMLKQYLFRKKVIGNNDIKYILIFDHWAKNNYYHWMIDSLSRIQLLSGDLNEYVVLLPEDCPKFIQNTLKFYPDVNIKLIKKNTLQFIPNLFIQDFAAGSGRQHPVILKSVRSHILNQFPSIKSEKFIYVSRQKQKVRRISNENEVLGILRKYNFETVCFEDHSLEEQIKIAQSAKILLSSHGANLTNSLFMQEGCSVFELIRNDVPNFCYFSMATGLGLNYYYQLCEINDHDNLLVDLVEFEVNLKLLLK